MSEKTKPLRIGKVRIGGTHPAFILGPCVIESEKFVRRMAKKIAEICAAGDVDFIFKASYDKANRSSVRSFRGIGVREGCEILSAIGRDLKMPVDRKSTRLNSSHSQISYAVFCLKKKTHN